MPSKKQPQSEYAKALRTFTDAIDATGGVVRHGNGTLAPEVDMGWTDLGDAYVVAKRALGETFKAPASGYDNAEDAEAEQDGFID